MSYRLWMFACIIVAGVIVGCSTDDTIAPSSNLSVTCRIDNVTTSSVGLKGAHTAGDKADSVIVTRVRVLVERLVLHPSNANDSADDRSIKAGPFVFLADSSGTRVVASVNLTPGMYDKLKYEVHRFSSSEVPSYQNDPQFADFVSTDRYSIIIDGHLVRSGARKAFQYKSDITSNIELPLASFTVPATGSVSANVVFSTAKAFLGNGQMLDPTDPKNESAIDNNLKAAFRLNP
jgi:hypothetical protein